MTLDFVKVPSSLHNTQIDRPKWSNAGKKHGYHLKRARLLCLPSNLPQQKSSQKHQKVQIIAVVSKNSLLQVYHIKRIEKKLDFLMGTQHASKMRDEKKLAKKTQPNWAIEAEKCNTVRRKPQPVRSPASFKAQNNTLLLDNENLQKINHNKELENQIDWLQTETCVPGNVVTHTQKIKTHVYSSKNSSTKSNLKKHRCSSSECFSSPSSG